MNISLVRLDAGERLYVRCSELTELIKAKRTINRRITATLARFQGENANNHHART